MFSVAAIAAVCAAAPVMARPGPNSPTATHTNPSSCLGAERATRNSSGGERAHGGFGTAQSTYVKSLKGTGANYGQTLQTFKSGCTYAPGTMHTNTTNTMTTHGRGH